MKVENVDFYVIENHEGKITKVLKHGVVFTYSDIKIYAYDRPNRLTTHFIDEYTGLSFDSVMYYLPEAIKHISKKNVKRIKEIRNDNEEWYQESKRTFNELEVHHE